MKNLLIILCIPFFFSCKKEQDNPTPKKGWDDVKTIQVQSARLGSIHYKFSDTLALTFVGTGLEVSSISPWTGAGTTFVFDPFFIDKETPFLVTLKSENCPRFPGEECFQDKIFGYPKDFSESLNEDWTMKMDSMSIVIFRIQYGF